MRTNRRKWLTVLAAAAALCALPERGTAGAIGYVGTAGWGVAGTVVDLSCVTCVQTWTSPFSVTLLDGLVVSGIANETFTTVGGLTTSAYERVTNIVAVNTGIAPVSDNIYIFSDLFSPSIAGTAGVGIAGYYGAAGLGGIPVGGVYGASSQAQMNFLTAAAVLGAAPAFALTTVPTFVICNPCLTPTFFWEATRGVSGGGVVELVGGLNFTLDPGSEIYLPGSLIIDDNDPSIIAGEAPEPASFAALGGGLILIGFLKRRSPRK